MKKIIAIIVISTGLAHVATAQVKTPAQQLILTSEDSLHAGAANSKTVISGYGSAFYQRNANAQTALVTLERAVLFVGHQFNSKISFFSELEIENAKVDDGGGEISMEQAFLKFSLNSRQYLTAGLFTPRIGILNENHLPVNFNGVERPLVEQLIIPATWRELGIGFYGRSKKIPLSYSAAVLNGLNGSGFEHGSGISGGRFEGRDATANNLAFTAALQYFYKELTFQVSGYAGGTNGFGKRKSDSLQLSSGVFGMPVYLAEADVRWSKGGWNAKALGTYISFPGAGDINRAFDNNTASGMYGAYGELAYNVFEKNTHLDGQELNVFARYEALDMNASIPSNAIYDGTQKQHHLIAGIGYLPNHNVVIKADVRLLHTGKENPDLVVNPSPVRLPYLQNNSFINLGIGYSF